MENVILKKKDGQVVVMNLTPTTSMKLKDDSIVHLCWGGKDCKNFCKHAGPTECKKIGDAVKKKIDEYDFITDGIQTLDDKGKVDTFLVTGCSNYERVGEKRKLTPEEKAHFRSLRNSIKTLYFEAGSVDEAHIRQYMDMIHGLLKNAEDKTISKEVIIDKIMNAENDKKLKNIIEPESVLTEIFIYEVKELIKNNSIVRAELSKRYGKKNLTQMLKNDKLDIATAQELYKHVKKISDKITTAVNNGKLEDVRLNTTYAKIRTALFEIYGGFAVSEAEERNKREKLAEGQSLKNEIAKFLGSSEEDSNYSFEAQLARLILKGKVQKENGTLDKDLLNEGTKLLAKIASERNNLTVDVGKLETRKKKLDSDMKLTDKVEKSYNIKKAEREAKEEAYKIEINNLLEKGIREGKCDRQHVKKMV